MEDEHKTFTVKITMPEHVAIDFLEETEEHFGGCRWLNLLYKQRIYAFFMKNPNIDRDIKRELLDIRADMFTAARYYAMLNNKKKGE